MPSRGRGHGSGGGPGRRKHSGAGRPDATGKPPGSGNGSAQEQRLRAGADEARGVLLKRAAELRRASGGSVPGCFASVPDPRSRRGRRYSLPCILTLVLSAMLHGKTKLAGITAWIAHAGQEALAAAGARAGRDGRLQAPCPKTVTRLLA